MSIEIKVSKEYLAGTKVMLGTPMYGGNATGVYTKSVADLAVMLNQWGVGLNLFFLMNESLITRARNYVADQFMRSDCTHLIFIDADIGFEPRDVMALLALLNDDSEFDVLAGVYAKKTISWEKIKDAVDKGYADQDPQALEQFVGDFVFNPMPGVMEIPLDKPVEVAEAGTGFMMIKRRAFEKVAAARPDLLYRPDHVRTADFDGSREIMAYFMDPIDKWDREKLFRETLERIANATDDDERIAAGEYAREALAHQEPETRRLLSEDYFFSHEVRKAGGKVGICPWMQFQHFGTYSFGGSLAALAQIGASPTVDPSKVGRRK